MKTKTKYYILSQTTILYLTQTFETLNRTQHIIIKNSLACFYFSLKSSIKFKLKLSPIQKRQLIQHKLEITKRGLPHLTASHRTQNTIDNSAK